MGGFSLGYDYSNLKVAENKSTVMQRGAALQMFAWLYPSFRFSLTSTI